ncbi:YadA-like family protein [Sphingomonas sp. UV9]|uniref:beta strand repeat-containing protein n=1 Tax=Sphingomonas sp. UV9 TaxID=1851410 RepID=UPI0013E8C289|nr:YadA-like family protein [Sphingomonas sp. UV9]
MRQIRGGVSLIGLAAATTLASQPAAAQVVPPPNVVGVCSGVSLPKSVVTEIMRPVIGGVVTPIENTLNPILTTVNRILLLPLVGGLIPALPATTQTIDVDGLLTSAANGDNITLSVLDVNGNAVGPNSNCVSQADGFELRNPAGIAIGGNRITGLGATGAAAFAGEANSIAFGNAALTDATALGAIALGTNSSVGANATGAVALGTGASATGANGVALGAGSLAARGPQAGYTAIGLAVPQNSAGEVSVGTVGGERQITNVAAGSAATDAVNVGQLAGVQAQIGTAATLAVQYDDATRAKATLGGVGPGVPPVALTNVAAGALDPASTDAVNGSQLLATNTNVTNLTTNINNGAIGALQYSDAATPTVPNGGVPSNDAALVGAVAGPVGLHNVANGVVAAGSTDAVNGGQLFATNTNVTNTNTALTTLTTNISNGGIGAVQYSNAATPTVPNGGIPSNDVALVGAAAGPVGLHNVAAGVVATGSTDAVNGGQLSTVVDQVGTLNTLAVQYDDATRARVSLGGVGAAPVGLGNVAAGALGATSTDAVNGSQLFATNTNVTNLTTNIANGAIGALQYSNAGTPTTPNGGVPSNDATLVGGAAGAVALHNVADGVVATGSTDAVNGGQLALVSGQVGTLNGLAVQYDDLSRSRVTFGGAGAAPVVLGNVGAGTLGATSAEAVNGSQLFATNTNVTNTNTALTNLTTNISNGGIGAVQYSNAATPTTPNGGVPTNDVALVGVAAGPVGLHNVADGVVATGSTDAVNGGQLATVSGQVGGLSALAVQYDDLGRTRVTLGGVGTGAAPVTIGNVAAGALGAGSTDAVNGAQLGATNDAVFVNTTNIATINTSVTGLQANALLYDSTLQAFNANRGGVAQRITNVAAGGLGAGSLDAVNGGQLSGLGSSVASALGGSSIYDPATGAVTAGILYGGTTYGSVQGAVSAIETSIGGMPTGADLRYFNATSVMADSQAMGTDSTAIGPNAIASADGSIAAGRNTVASSAGSVAIGDGSSTIAGRAVSIGFANIASGDGAVAIGDPNIATGDGAVALGRDNQATGIGAVALGDTNFATGNGSVSIGQTNQATGNGTIAIGTSNVINGLGAVAVGNRNQVNGDASLAFGSDVVTNGINTLVVGNASSATGDFAAAFGSNSVASGLNATALGTAASATADFTLAVGERAIASGFGSSALGTLSSATAFASTALGAGAIANLENSVALGSASSTLRGGVASYTAFGVTGAQSSIGEIAVARTADYIDPATGLFAPLGTRQITGVGAGSEDTDAVNVAQLRGVSNTLGSAFVTSLGGGAAYNVTTGAITGPSYVINGTTYTNVGDALAGVGGQIGQVAANSVSYDNAAQTSVTLGGAGGTTITNVAAGAVNATSTDAVNGSQLNATNVQVANNTTAITNLGNQVANGGTGPVQYSNPGSVTTPNGGIRTNDLTLVGAATGPVGLHNVAGGSIAAGSTDAVNGGQVYALALTAVNAVSYDTDTTGARTNTVTLAGGNAAAPVTLANVAAGMVAAGSTQAVNGGQLNTTNQAVATAQGTADSALALGSNSVQYGPSRTNVTFNAGGQATVLSNVAAGVSTTDAVNVGQLNSGINSAVTQANSYTDGRIAALAFDIRSVRRDGYAGTSSALAAAGLPQAYEAGKGMVAIGGGTYAGQSAVAVGMSKAFNDGHTVVKLSGTYDSQGRAGASGGVGYQF